MLYLPVIVFLFGGRGPDSGNETTVVGALLLLAVVGLVAHAVLSPEPAWRVVLLAILVMASAVLGWLGGLVAWLIVLGALAVFAFCLRGRP